MSSHRKSIEAEITLEGYRSNPWDKNGTIRVVRTEIPLGDGMHDDIIVVYGMAGNSKAEVMDFLLEDFAIRVNGIDENLPLLCAGNCPYHCDDCDENFERHFHAEPADGVELGGIWFIRQKWFK